MFWLQVITPGLCSCLLNVNTSVLRNTQLQSRGTCIGCFSSLLVFSLKNSIETHNLREVCLAKQNKRYSRQMWSRLPEGRVNSSPLGSALWTFKMVLIVPSSCDVIVSSFEYHLHVILLWYAPKVKVSLCSFTFFPYQDVLQWPCMVIGKVSWCLYFCRMGRTYFQHQMLSSYKGLFHPTQLPGYSCFLG